MFLLKQKQALVQSTGIKRKFKENEKNKSGKRPYLFRKK